MSYHCDEAANWAQTAHILAGENAKREADLKLAHDLLRELRNHDARCYGPWTGGMRQRVAEALGEDGREARRYRPEPI